VCSFPACASFTETVNPYVYGSHTPPVNDFLTHTRYDVETREDELVFLRKGRIRMSYTRLYSSWACLVPSILSTMFESSRAVRGAQPRVRVADMKAGFTDFADVVMFHGAYSLFLPRYDGKEPSGDSATSAGLSLAQSGPMYRSFSDSF
jgi:hypothetical protein